MISLILSAEGLAFPPKTARRKAAATFIFSASNTKPKPNQITQK